MQLLCDIHPESKMKSGLYYVLESGMIWLHDEGVYFHEHETRHGLNCVDCFELYYKNLELEYETITELSLKEIVYIRQAVQKMRSEVRVERFVYKMR